MVKIQDISFSYRSKKDETLLIENFSLNVETGSFTTLLGPSGCGKTTLLRLIAGFIEPFSGGIFIDGKNQRGIEPNKRKVGMVFQDYALFPHMTVSQNIAYPLSFSCEKLSKEEKIGKVLEISKAVNIESLLRSYPSELSGGQQQRVALARAMVQNPKVLLMDEPLSSLDSKLRERVREELKEIQSQLKITTVYVTHDQDEALSLSDKIAVINAGKLLQEGSPHDIYFSPTNAFTADFVGKANFLCMNGRNLMVRPEWLSLSTGQDYDISGKILSLLFLGKVTRAIIGREDGDEKLTADLPTLSAESLKTGQAVFLKILHSCNI